MAELYTSLQLQSATYPNKWIRNGWQTWKVWLESLGLVADEHAFDFSACKHDMSEIATSMATQHMCLSLPALLLLLSRFCSVGTGRVRHESDNMSLGGCLRLLLEAVTRKHPEFELLLFPKGCTFGWPLFLNPKESTELCKVAAGMIDTSVLSIACKKLLPKSLAPRLHIYDFIIALASCGKDQSHWLAGA
eukprot:1466860-Amphidinium_carterae.1